MASLPKNAAGPCLSPAADARRVSIPIAVPTPILIPILFGLSDCFVEGMEQGNAWEADGIEDWQGNDGLRARHPARRRRGRALPEAAAATSAGKSAASARAVPHG